MNATNTTPGERRSGIEGRRRQMEGLERREGGR